MGFAEHVLKSGVFYECYCDATIALHLLTQFLSEQDLGRRGGNEFKKLFQ